MGLHVGETAGEMVGLVVEIEGIEGLVEL